MKQNKKWMLVAIALLALVALPLVGCKNAADGTGDTHTHSFKWVGDANTNKVTEKCTVCGHQNREILDFVYVKGDTVDGTSMESGVFEGRTVTLSDFFIGKYEVTQAEWKAVMGENPSYFQGDSEPPATDETQEKRPVESVSWYDAVVYCNKRSMAEGLTPCYKKGSDTNPDNWGTVPTTSDAEWKAITCDWNANGYRLPTEAEWEYAARGGAPDADDWNYVFSGADTAEGVESDSPKNPGLDQVGWYWYNILSGTTEDTEPSINDSEYGTHQVGKKTENSLGIHDMSGNVWEWCWDWYDSNPKKGDTGGESPVTNPTGPSSGSNRVGRGGSWGGNAIYCRVSNRYNYNPFSRNDRLGFRVVRSAR